MGKEIEDIAKKLGAKIVGTVPDYSAGAFGVAKLAHVLRARLEPGRGPRNAALRMRDLRPAGIHGPG